MDSQITTTYYLQEYIFWKLLQDARKFLSGKLLVKGWNLISSRLKGSQCLSILIKWADFRKKYPFCTPLQKHSGYVKFKNTCKKETGAYGQSAMPRALIKWRTLLKYAVLRLAWWAYGLYKDEKKSGDEPLFPIDYCRFLKSLLSHSKYFVKGETTLCGYKGKNKIFIPQITNN